MRTARLAVGVRYTASLVTSPKAKPALRQSSLVSSGNSSSSGAGRTTAPERLCPPHVFAFSITATGTSPSRSIVSGSSARSCSRRLAHDSPAVPPPTIATPTSISSSSASRPRLMNSLRESTGGGKAAGATFPLLEPPWPDMSASLLGLHSLGELGKDLVEVADDAEIGEFEDRRVRVLVDRDDVLRALHPDLVLDRPRDARCEVQLRRDRLARLADLRGVGVPAGVDDGSRGSDGAVAAERFGELLPGLEALGLAQAATARHEDVRSLDVDVRA